MYPKWWDKTLTIYNRKSKNVEGKTIISWQRKTVDNCFWGQTNGLKVNGLTIASDNKTIVRIPYDVNITLAPGDIVVLGAIDDNIPDMSSGNEILKRYQSFTVSAAKINAALSRTNHIWGSE